MMNSIWVVKRAHKGFFFSAGNMRFFRSTVSRNCLECGDVAVFVTGEKGPHDDGARFTVRKCDLNSGGISNVSEFQQYGSSAAAWAAARAYVEGLPK